MGATVTQCRRTSECGVGHGWHVLKPKESRGLGEGNASVSSPSRWMHGAKGHAGLSLSAQG